MKKPKKPPANPVCGTCGKEINLTEVLDALENARPYIHPCGRILVKGTNP